MGGFFSQKFAYFLHILLDSHSCHNFVLLLLTGQLDFRSSLAFLAGSVPLEDSPFWNQKFKCASQFFLEEKYIIYIIHLWNNNATVTHSTDQSKSLF